MAIIQKYQDNKFHNNLTDKKTTSSLFSPRNMGNIALSPVHARQMKEATGLKSISPDRIATERAIQHYKDNQSRIKRDQAKKAQFKRDLEIQMQEKIFKRENERLYMDDK